MATLWAAVITAVPALFAIFFAYRVGRRQIDIQGKQSDIMEKQSVIAERVAGIEEMKLKRELFDDRFDVYHATREWIRFIIGESRPPRVGPHAVEGEEQIIKTFLAEWDRSRFLFAPSVHKELRRLLTLSHQLHYHWKMRKGVDASGIDHADKEEQILAEFYLVSEDISAIFGDDLVLARSNEPLPDDITDEDDELFHAEGG